MTIRQHYAQEEATMVKPDGPIEVWLSQKNMRVICTVVHEDERTEQLDVDALSIRGAEREITGWLIEQGFKPAGRWRTEDESGDEREVSRQFVPAKEGLQLQTRVQARKYFAERHPELNGRTGTVISVDPLKVDWDDLGEREAIASGLRIAKEETS
jgi:hypothetical protein